MNKILFSALFFSILLHCNALLSQPGWFLQPSGTNVFLWDMDFVNPNTGFIGADGGRILKTTNGGNNWVINIINPSVNFISLDFSSVNTGFAAGSNGIMYKTTNTGVSWAPVSTPVSFAVQAINFIDDNTGFFAGGDNNDGAVYKTTNSGLNWIRYGPGSVYAVALSISFPNAQTGFVSCYDGRIMRSTNSGINWQFLNTGLSDSIPCFSVYFPGPDTGYAVNVNGEIVKTVNSGNNWVHVYNNPYYGIVNVFFINGLTGFALAGHFDSGNISQIILRTMSGGGTWAKDSLPNMGHLNNILFTTPLEGYISCQNGLIYKTTNGGNPIGITQISNELPDKFSLYQNYPNPFNPVTSFKFQVSGYNPVKITLYDILGKNIEILLNEQLSPGLYEARWDASDIASGIYYCVLESGTFRQTIKMVLLK